MLQLVHRDAERKISSLKQELEALRRSYATLEADYQDGEASYRELQDRLERRESKLLLYIACCDFTSVLYDVNCLCCDDNSLCCDVNCMISAVCCFTWCYLLTM